MGSLFIYIVTGLAVVLGLVLLIVLFNFFGIWLRAKVVEAEDQFPHDLALIHL